MHLARFANQAISATPLLSDLKEHYWSFYRNKTAVRGVFETFDEAVQSIPNCSAIGYDQPGLAPDQSLSEITASKALGDLHPRDYPVLFWLKSTFPSTRSVFNIGGNVGVEYYAYAKYLPELTDLPWTVCEVPNTVAAGRRLAKSRNATNLSFTGNVDDGDGCSTALCVGVLQYLPYALTQTMARWKSKPKHVIVGTTPVWDGPDFVTIQNLGYAFVPYRVFSKAKLKASFLDLGYRQLDEWKYPLRLSVPFSRSHTIDYYSGFVFARD